MSWLLIGLGGFFGGLARYQLGKVISKKTSASFPLGTFLINLSGALLLGLLISLDAGKIIYLLLGDGFLGAYTTFSTFMYEGFTLFQENEKRNAFVYILLSLVLGVLGYAAGFAAGSSLAV